VDDKVAVILEDPFGVVITFYADGQFSPVLQLQVDLVADRLVLFGVVPGAD
jgi:hypothetical protein